MDGNEEVETDIRRRQLLVAALAAPVLTLVASLGMDDAKAGVLPSLPDLGQFVDLGDVMIAAAKLTPLSMAILQITADSRIRLSLPRAEVGQGIATAAGMILAEELDARLSDVDVVLSDARPDLMFNQLTGSSNAVRSLWNPLRELAAQARARLVTAAANQWRVAAGQLTTRDTAVHAPDGRSAAYGALSAAAAGVVFPLVSAAPKQAAEYRLIGTPVTRVDALDIVTGKARYATDLDVPGALPTVVARAPTIKGTVRSYDPAVVRSLPGVVALADVPTGVAIVAQTFGQALAAKAALEASDSFVCNPGTVAGLSDADIAARLQRALPPLLPPLLARCVDASLSFAFVSHAPMEVLTAVADVRSDRAEIWYAGQSPVVAQTAIAAELGMLPGRVTVHVVRGGGSFGRRLFWDSALEAAQISKAVGRPVKLMWSRNDDVRQGRMRPASMHRLRATYGLGTVLSFEHRTAAVPTDASHGIGDAFSAVIAGFTPALASQAFFTLSQTVPYHFGIVTNTLTEIPLDVPTGSLRSVFSGMTGTANEVMVDRLAQAMGRDPVDFRRTMLSSARARAVLDKVAAAGPWGRPLPPGWAQGVAVWEEYRSAVAYLVEIDASNPQAPRVMRAVAAADVGRAINPSGLEGQLLGCLTDGISYTLYAGLNIKDGAVVQGSYKDFHYARMRHSPPRFEAYILPPSGDPGGAGELGVPAAAAAVANAYARATGIQPSGFPIPGLQW